MTNNWNTSLYDEKHSFVWQRGTDLLPLLDAKTGEKILDLGCGTGHLSDRIAQTGAIVLGIDSSPKMIAQARQCYPTLNFEIIDGENLPYHTEFDAIFSNAALHWMTQPERAIEGIWRSLVPGGRFVAEFGGKGNVGTIVEALCRILVAAGYPEPTIENLWYFPSIGEYTTLLEQQGFDVSLALLFDRPTPLDGDEGMQNWLAMFAASLLTEIPTERQPEILTAVERQLRPHLYRNSLWYADYRRLRVVATKPDL
ncbi:MAG: class I SAM-dependent methyltransferase [Geitlerinemataceae cyanobacterium]